MSAVHNLDISSAVFSRTHFKLPGRLATKPDKKFDKNDKRKH